MTRHMRGCICILFVALTLAACSHRDDNTYQGYVEGEFVYLASSQPGTLTQLSGKPSMRARPSSHSNPSTKPPRCSRHNSNLLPRAPNWPTSRPASVVLK
jgi:hypothetical protein